MEQNRFFLVITRINSLLILMAAIGAVISLISLTILSNSWSDRNTVEVVSDDTGNESVELRLSTLNQMIGHEIQTVDLMSDAPSKRFSSGSRGTKTRNVLFLVGEDLNPKWLYEENGYLINCFCKLQVSNKYRGDDPVLAVYVSVIKEDTNKDEKLSEEDGITLALMNPDGSNYKEIGSIVSKVLDSTVTDSGESVTFLLQVGNDILVRKYSLESFSLISEQQISEITKR